MDSADFGVSVYGHAGIGEMPIQSRGPMITPMCTRFTLCRRLYLVAKELAELMLTPETAGE